MPSTTESSTVSSGGSTAARLLRLFVIAFTVARGAYAADECAAAKRNCEADAGCLACRTVETTPVACATTTTTCDGWWAMACCLYGSSSICLQSELLLGYLRECNLFAHHQTAYFLANLQLNIPSRSTPPLSIFECPTAPHGLAEAGCSGVVFEQGTSVFAVLRSFVVGHRVARPGLLFGVCFRFLVSTAGNLLLIFAPSRRLTGAAHRLSRGSRARRPGGNGSPDWPCTSNCLPHALERWSWGMFCPRSKPLDTWRTRLAWLLESAPGSASTGWRSTTLPANKDGRYSPMLWARPVHGWCLFAFLSLPSALLVCSTASSASSASDRTKHEWTLQEISTLLPSRLFPNNHSECLAQGNDCIIDGVCPGDDDGGTDRGAADAADNDDDPTASTDSDDDPDSEPGAGAIGGGGDDAQGEGNDLDLELTRSPARATFACSAALSLALPLAVSGASALL